MKQAYFECFSGVSGDMLLSALFDAGAPVDVVVDTLAKLGIDGLSLVSEKTTRGHLAASAIRVKYPRQHEHRHLSHILKIIDDAGLGEVVSKDAKAVFRRLAEAEAAVHGMSLEKVHFHEVGAADAIADIVGTCAAIDALGIESVRFSAINVGSGTVECEHGIMPVPAPAVAMLLKGVRTFGDEEPGERATPTGAAILVALGEQVSAQPAMRVESIGLGAGTREFLIPNVVRVVIGNAGETDSPHVDVDSLASELGVQSDHVVLLECDLDDLSPEHIPDLRDALFAAGAIDVGYSPYTMKEGRPGMSLRAVCLPAQAAAVSRALFRHSSTLGVRMRVAERLLLRRQFIKVSTRYGPVRVKVGYVKDEAVTVSPEHRDCREVADRSGVAVQEVHEAAIEAYRGSSTN